MTCLCHSDEAKRAHRASTAQRFRPVFKGRPSHKAIRALSGMRVYFADLCGDRAGEAVIRSTRRGGGGHAVAVVQAATFDGTPLRRPGYGAITFEVDPRDLFHLPDGWREDPGV